MFNKFRNKGYGTKILNDDFNNLVKEKIDYLECLVDIDNIASYKLFIKNGFKEYKKENNFIYLKKNY